MSDLAELKRLNDEKGRLIAKMEELDAKYGVDGPEALRAKADELSEAADAYDELVSQNDELAEEMEALLDELDIKYDMNSPLMNNL